MKRTGSISFAAAAAVLLATAASAEELRIGLRTETTSIDPNFWTTVENQQISDHVFEPLVLKDHSNRLQPGLALTWTPLNDNDWEFKLRRNAKFHDGSPFTADDVIFSFERAQNITGSSNPSGRYLRGKVYKKIDDDTVVISPGKPFPTLPNELANVYMVSKKNAEGKDVAAFNSGEAAIGTGPFKFVEWVKGDRIVIAANTDHWGGPPAWDKVTFRVIASDPVRLAALLKGDVDIINAVPTADLPKVTKNPDLTVASVAGERVVFLEMDSNRDLTPYVTDNDGKPLWPNPLRDWRVRKALSMAINRQGIVDRVMDGAAVPAGQLATPGMYGHNPNLKPEAYDLGGAQKLLAEAGYPNGFRLTIHGTTDDHPNDAKIVETIAGMLERAGIKAKVETMPKSVYYARGRTGGEYGLPAFSFFLFSFGPGTGEGSLELNAVLHTVDAPNNLGSNNYGRYSNARADVRLREALVTLDDAKREQMLRDVAEIYFKDVAVIPVHYQMNVWALRKGLTYQARLREGTLAMGVARTR